MGMVLQVSRQLTLGLESSEWDEECPGCPSSVDMDVIIATVEENPRYIFRELEDALKIPRITTHNHLTRLDYVNRSGVWLPHELTEQKILERVSLFVPF